jgi:capsular polysaccharide export protein
VIHNKVILFAFRTSQIKFFNNILKENKTSNYIIKTTKKAIIPSFKAFKDIHNIDFTEAITFAVDEFYAKTSNFKIPKFIIQSFFTTMAYFNYFRYYKVLDNNYSKMLIWNGGKFRQRIAIEIAKLFSIKVYYYENGLMPNRIVLDKRGINYNNSVPRNKDFFINYENNKNLPTELIPRISKHKDKFEIQTNPLPEKYIFVPFQVDYDTQILSQSPWITSMRVLFDVIEKASKNTNIHFILKEHPSSHINYPDLHKRVKNIVNISFENGYATQELIQNSIAVITINSTVGVESLLFSKKVIPLGKAFYDIENISFGAKNIKELINTIQNIDNIAFNKQLVDNFLKYLYYDYLIIKDEKMYNNFVRFINND